MLSTMHFAPEDSGPSRLSIEALCIARIRALESVLGNGSAIRWHSRVAVSAPVPLPVAPKRKRTAIKATMTGEEFFDARMVACRAIAAELGTHWHLVEGATHWCTIPSKLRSFKTPIVRDEQGEYVRGGTTIKCRGSARLPAARYWPGGRLPEGVTASEDLPRDRTPIAVVRRLASARNVERLQLDYERAQSRAARSNSRFHDSRFGQGFDSEDRESDIRAAWDLRRELLQAKRDATELGAIHDLAETVARQRPVTRGDVMSCEMDMHATRVAMLNNAHRRVSHRESWRDMVQATWDARRRLRNARAAYALAQAA